ncbi:MAG: hypothetical protein ABIR79_10580 [Candidatus Binatia bacterium]
MLDEWVKAIGTIPCPFDQYRIDALGHPGLYERRTFSDHGDGESRVDEQRPVAFPARAERFIGIVKEVDVARESRRRQELVQRDTDGNVALTGRDPALC